MLFRQLYMRRLTQAFGDYLSREQLAAIVADKSEWACLRLLLAPHGRVGRDIRQAADAVVKDMRP